MRDRDRVLIHGGSGSLGLMILQFSKVLKKDCEIIVTCSDHNFEKVMLNGANQAVRYQENNLIDIVFPGSVDYIIDLFGESDRLMPVLKKDGRYSHLHPPLSNPQELLNNQLKYGKNFYYEILDWIVAKQGLTGNKDEILQAVAHYAEEKVITPIVTKEIPLCGIANIISDTNDQIAGKTV